MSTIDSNNLTSGEAVTYTLNDKGPFKVNFEYLNDDPNKILSKLKIGQFLTKKCNTNFYDIKKFSRKTHTVFLRSRDEANKLIDSKIIKKAGIKAYIPWSYVVVSGVIRYVEDDIDLDNLKEDLIKEKYEVVNISRMTRMANDTRIPTKSVKITLRRSLLPDFLYIYRQRIHVSPFLSRIKQCDKCLRFGHNSNNCKGKQRCKNCGSGDHCDKGCAIIKCIHCKKNHSALDFACEERKRQKDIKDIMAKQNVSFFEAMDLHPHLKRNNFKQIDVTDLSQFPVLNDPGKRKRSEEHRTDYSEVVSVAHQRSKKIASYKDQKKKFSINDRLREIKESNSKLLTAEQPTNQLAGPAYEFNNSNKVSQIEKVFAEFADKYKESNVFNTENILQSAVNTIKNKSILENNPSSVDSNSMELY
jgi:hypothetical protein